MSSPKMTTYSPSYCNNRCFSRSYVRRSWSKRAMNATLLFYRGRCRISTTYSNVVCAKALASPKNEGAKLKQALANHAWFVGFAPEDSPEIVVAALYENGEESYNAVPIVRDVLKAYFDKKTRQSESQVAKLTPFVQPSIFAAPRVTRKMFAGLMSR